MKTKFRLKIAPKFALWYGIVIISAIISYSIIIKILADNKRITQEVNENIIPSMSLLNNFSYIIFETNDLIKYWILTKPNAEDIKKKRLSEIYDSVYPDIKIKLIKYSENRNIKENDKLIDIIEETDKLFNQYKNIMNKLKSIENYEDSITIHKCKLAVNDNSKIYKLTESAKKNLNELRITKKESVLAANSDMNSSFSIFRKIILLSGLILFFLIILIAVISIRSIVKPINYLKNIIFHMSSGELPKEKIRTATDETGQMGVALNELIKGLKDKASFAAEIGKENFDSEFKPVGTKDVLGNSLLQMRDSLIQASEDAEIRRIENQQRSWSSQGLAEFNEIIREHSETLEDFTAVTTSKLTKYLNAQVGGMYIINDEDLENKHLELISFYAYDRQKFLTKKIEFGENLVGQCVLEKDTIYMTDIPKDYVHITSGLGIDNPKSLLIVPLKLNEIVYGVVELASFSEFEKYQIDFVEKTGEILASTIANIKTQIQTKELLNESNEKSERLAKQEEESQKNIAQLEANLGELKEKNNLQNISYRKKEDEFKNEVKSFEKKIKLKDDEFLGQKKQAEIYQSVLNNSAGIVETNITGVITKTNKLFLRMTGLSFIELSGKSLDDFVEKTSEDKFNKIYSDLKHGMLYQGTMKYYFKGQEKLFFETYTPIKDTGGNYSKIIISSVDITDIE